MTRKPPLHGSVADSSRSSDRAQAFTLEGFIAAFILLIAVLFAVQSVVITPGTGGAVDRTAQAQVQQQVQDSLVVSQQENDLSVMVRNISLDDDDEDDVEVEGFCVADGDPVDQYDRDQFENETKLGEILAQQLDTGQSYNVELHYQSGDERDSFRLVDQGPPSSTAVTASYTVALHDNQSITCEGEDGTLGEIDDEGEYIEPDDETDVYNVVEIRVVVW